MGGGGADETPSSSAEAPLLPIKRNEDAVEGCVDFRNCPVFRSSSGGWTSAFFIIGVEVAERFAYYGISSNLITYLTGPLGQSTAAAAANVNAWAGAASLFPLLGAFFADSFLGRYRTIILASLLYVLNLLAVMTTTVMGFMLGVQPVGENLTSEVLSANLFIRVENPPTHGLEVLGKIWNWYMGLGLLTLSALLPYFGASFGVASGSLLQIWLFFFSLYMVALAQGGHKPCVQAFGADQFDAKDPYECQAKSSFFNWWYFCMCGGPLVALSLLIYVQDNLNWGLGFGIPCVVMICALGIFLLGSRTYRHCLKLEEKSAFVRIGRVYVAAIKNCRVDPSVLGRDELALPSKQFQCLNKALLAPDGSMGKAKVCSFAEVEEAKAVLRLFPIWVTCLMYAIVFAQSSTFFTKQGLTMDRSIAPGFEVPPAALQSFISIGIIIFIPIYDGIFVPVLRNLTKKPSGVSMLQRIGIGMLLSAFSMAVAALVETKRLNTAKQFGIVDMPNVTVPMSFWWLVPQYVLFGVADVFTMVGIQEFFYDQVPDELRSVGLSLYLSIFGVGSFLSSFLISLINKMTGGNDGDGWFANNLNRAHLDYFYWLLAGLSVVELVAYLYFSKLYVYKRVQAHFFLVERVQAH